MGKNNVKIPNFSAYQGEVIFIDDGVQYTRHQTCLGAGAFGRTYLCEAEGPSSPLKQRAVVKFESKGTYLDQQGQLCMGFPYGLRFYKESQWQQKVNKWGVFSGDIKSRKDAHYVLMAYIEGDTLEKASLKIKTWRMMLLLWMKAAKAVDDFHRDYRAVHGDIKADNMMVVSFDQPTMAIKLIDFGLTEAVGTSIRPKHGSPGLSHFAPELFGEEIKLADFKQDVFSLGRLLAWLERQVTTKPDDGIDAPYVATQRNKLMAQHVWHRPAIMTVIDAFYTKFFIVLPSHTELSNESRPTSDACCQPIKAVETPPLLDQIKTLLSNMDRQPNNLMISAIGAHHNLKKLYEALSVLQKRQVIVTLDMIDTLIYCSDLDFIRALSKLKRQDRQISQEILCAVKKFHRPIDFIQACIFLMQHHIDITSDMIDVIAAHHNLNPIYYAKARVVVETYERSLNSSCFTRTGFFTASASILNGLKAFMMTGDHTLITEVAQKRLGKRLLGIFKEEKLLSDEGYVNPQAFGCVA